MPTTFQDDLETVASRLRARGAITADATSVIVSFQRSWMLARFRAIGEGVKQIAQLAAEQAFAELSRVPSGSAESAPSHGGGGWSVEHGAVNKWPTQNISHSSSKASLSGMLGGPEKPDIRPDLTGASSRRRSTRSATGAYREF